MFTKATKLQAKLRFALIAPPGAGKTWTALEIAKGLGGKIALIDTEHKSASKYAGHFDFDTAELETFSPETYIKAIQEAERLSYDVLIIDSLSHAWTGTGGVLEIVDRAKNANASKNGFNAWSVGTPKHNALVEAILRCKCHVIATMRSKTEWVIEQGANGKNTPRKVGLGAVQRDGVEYEFDFVGLLDHAHMLTIDKTRWNEIEGAIIEKPDSSLGERLLGWLNDGATPAQLEDTLQPYNHGAIEPTEAFLPDRITELLTIAGQLFNLTGPHLETRVLKAASAILGESVTNLHSLYHEDGDRILEQITAQAIKKGVWKVAQ
jgi:AAA domain